MNSQLLKTGIIVTTLIFMFSGAAWSQDRHQDRQMNRIHRGVVNGDITKKEYQKLQRNRCRIQSAKKRAWSDGKITRQERNRLVHMKKKAGKNIYKATHNRHSQRFHKYNNHPGYHKNHGRKFEHHDTVRSHSKHDKRYTQRASRHNGFLFSGAWLEPDWGFSFFSDNRCRR